VSENPVVAAHVTAADAALGALVAANAPALTELDVSWNGLSDAALRPLFEALPFNTHLRTLSVVYNGTSDAFARDVLLPAVRANTSLRKLRALEYERFGGLTEAVVLVAARGGGSGAA
jgi:hypothetical protein